MERIPRKPDARFEVFRRWIAQERTTDSDRSACCRALRAVRQADDLLESCGRHAVARSGYRVARNLIGVRGPCCHLIPQTQVHRERLSSAPVILDVSRKETLPETHFMRTARSQSVKLIRSIAEKSSQGSISVHPAIGAQLLQHVVLHVFVSEADLERVRASSHEGIIVNLDGIPCVGEAVKSSQTVCGG